MLRTLSMKQRNASMPTAIILLCLLQAALCVTHCRDKKPRYYRINLDEAPSQRWRKVNEDFRAVVPMVNDLMRQLIPTSVLRSTVRFVVRQIHTLLPKEMLEELSGISQQTGLRLDDLILLNIIYDVTAFSRACTSIVAEDADGRIWHGRNLDYPIDLLRNMTIMADFKINGTTLYSGITFAFYVGLITGQRPHAYSISLNARESGRWWEDLLAVVVERRLNPVAFMLRNTLEKSSTFDDAVSHLSTVWLTGPSYIIVGGTQHGEGAVITRDRLVAADVWRLMPLEGRWYVLETNYDHWKSPGDKRRFIAEKALNATGQTKINAGTMFSKILSIAPVKNDFTVYTTVMSAADPSLIFSSTKIRC